MNKDNIPSRLVSSSFPTSFRQLSFFQTPFALKAKVTIVNQHNMHNTPARIFSIANSSADLTGSATDCTGVGAGSPGCGATVVGFYGNQYQYKPYKTKHRLTLRLEERRIVPLERVITGDAPALPGGFGACALGAATLPASLATGAD